MDADRAPADEFVLRASAWRLGGMNIVGLLVILALPFITGLTGETGDAEAYVIIGLVVAALLSADFVVWYVSGVRELRIGADTMTAITGWRGRTRTIRGADITQVHEVAFFGRPGLQILLGAPARVTPGVYTYYPHPKIRLTSDPFDPDAAAEAFRRIQAMVARAQPPAAPGA